MTPLQAAMIVKIATDEYTNINGGEPETPDETVTWAEMIIETAQDKGVVTSLINAELVTHSGKGKDAVIGLTDKGLIAYKSLSK